MASIQLNFKTVSWSLGVLGALIATTAIITWEIRKDYLYNLKQEVQSYEKVNQAKLPDIANKLSSLSETLTLKVRERKHLQDLKHEVSNHKTESSKLVATIDKVKKDFTKQITDLREEFGQAKKRYQNEIDEKSFEISQKANQVNQLQEQIKNIETKIVQAFAKTNEITLKEGEAFPLIKNSCFLGVESIYSSWLDANLNGKKTEFRPGKEISFLFSGYECKVALTKLDDASDTATFLWFYHPKR